MNKEISVTPGALPTEDSGDIKFRAWNGHAFCFIAMVSLFLP